jgi:hypothetical protein
MDELVGLPIAFPMFQRQLLKYGKLNLTQYFHRENCKTWDDAVIHERSVRLYN